MSLDGHSIQVQLWGFNPTLECWGIQGGACALMGDRGWGLCLLGDLGVGPVPAGGSGGACVCWGVGRGL